MNAFVRSSPAHAFQCTVWPRALATTWSQAATDVVCATATQAPAINKIPTPSAAARRIEKRSISGSDRSEDDARRRFGRKPPGRTPAGAGLLDHRSELFLVEPVAADAKVLIRCAVGKHG